MKEFLLPASETAAAQSFPRQYTRKPGLCPAGCLHVEWTFSLTDQGTRESPDSSFYTGSLGAALLMLPGASVFPSA